MCAAARAPRRPAALRLQEPFTWEVRDDAGVNILFPCINGRENCPCGFSSVLDLRNLHECFDEIIKLTKKVGYDKIALFSGRRKTFWATLL